ncbi:tRNA modification GTPase GTPBP3, mitochondrial [Daktulosphaira vitifoliae]|uniref:tRNA modification GTPase GTPBP3, mitochondrial n=1 Tax=Daktulosphaira vitifoliae TaxID=58002 RepID=UPI0021AAAAE5|nr:tRNA modification GTPase GTPBP3, mitochondrial [Daktulosphaira vitifoliae]
MNIFNRMTIIKECLKETFQSKVRWKSTIYALSSGVGKCGVSIIRVSGSCASNAVLGMTTLSKLPEPRKAYLKKIIDPITREHLDNGLLLWFPGPMSFTGEDSCEFQVHGGRAVVSSILQGLSKLPNFRPADPGEFTKMSYYNNKMDLTEVEGLFDLINADTEFQQKQALMQLEGSLRKLYSSWRCILLENLSNVEAYIDFSETDNIEENILDDVNLSLENLVSAIEAHLSDNRSGELLRDGVKVAIIGAPNTGKSSFLNFMCNREAAIVTNIPGTTRDIVQVSLDISGYSVNLIDTAGIRCKTSDIIEEIGINKAKDQAQCADLVILIVDVQQILKAKDINFWFQEYSEKMNVDLKKCLIFINKVDTVSINQLSKLKDMSIHSSFKVCFGSCITNKGLTKVMSAFKNHLHKLCGNPNFEQPRCSQIRHRYCLETSLFNIKKYLEVSRIDMNVDVAADYLRRATHYIGKITGHVSTEEMLDTIFSKFCIGK